MSSSTTNTRDRRVNRRRFPRGGIKITCLRGSLGLGKNLAVSLLDISETGIRMVVSSALDARQEVEVTLIGPRQCRPIKVRGDVVWCVPAADGTFCIGARFQKRLRFGDFREVCG